MDDKYETCNFLVELRLAEEATTRAREDYVEASIKASAADIVAFVARNMEHSTRNSVQIPWNTIKGGITWKLKELLADMEKANG